MAAITPEMVKQVALLGRLHVEGDALATVSAQLDQILAYVTQLQSVPTEQVEPTSHVLPLSNVLRQDVLRPSLAQAAVIALAPKAKPPFVTVPKVIETS